MFLDTEMKKIHFYAIPDKEDQIAYHDQNSDFNSPKLTFRVACSGLRNLCWGILMYISWYTWAHLTARWRCWNLFCAALFVCFWSVINHFTNQRYMIYKPYKQIFVHHGYLMKAEHVKGSKIILQHFYLQSDNHKRQFSRMLLHSFTSPFVGIVQHCSKGCKNVCEASLLPK